jgi:hypothetical protein
VYAAVRQCTQESYLIQLLVIATPHLKGTAACHLRYATTSHLPRSPPAGHTIRHGTLRPRETIRFCVSSTARALRAPAPRRAEQPRVTSRSNVLRAFRPSRAPLTARSGVGLSPSLLTPRLESALQHLRSSRFGVAAPLLVVPRKSPRASSIAHRIWPSDATSSRLHVTLTAFSTMT